MDRRIGADLARRRRELRLDLETVAVAAKLPARRLLAYERGTASVSAEHLYRLSGVLETAPEQFFQSSGEADAAKR